MVTEFVVTPSKLPKRLDVFLVNREPKLSRSALQRLIEQGRVRVNGQIVKPSHKIRSGEIIAFDIPKAEPLELKGESIPLEILYEDTVQILHAMTGGVPFVDDPCLLGLGKECPDLNMFFSSIADQVQTEHGKRIRMVVVHDLSDVFPNTH